MKRIILIILSSLLLILPVQAPRSPTTTTIPPITATSAGVVLECNPLLVSPGSVTIGSSGFIRVSCGSVGAVALDGAVIPSLSLGLGYTNASIVLHGSASQFQKCDFNFRTITVGNVTISTGAILTPPQSPFPTFASTPQPGQMLSTAYDYCLQYTNAQSTGLAGFSITWT